MEGVQLTAASLFFSSSVPSIQINALTTEGSIDIKNHLGFESKEEQEVANHASALKRVKQTKKRRARNKSFKSAISTKVKSIFTSVDEKDADGSKVYFKQAVARLDSAVNKGILHRRTASRKISRLTKRVNALSS